MHRWLRKFLNFRHTLFGKLYLAYLVLTIGVGVIHSFLFYNVWQSHSGRLTQVLNWDSAEYLAGELAPHTSPVFKRDAVESILLHHRLYSPGFEPFVISQTGSVIASVADDTKSIDMRDVLRFVNFHGVPKEPILSQLPQGDLAATEPLFSAFPILVEDRQAYVLVTLGSSTSSVTKRSFGDVDATFAAGVLLAVSSIAAGVIGWMIFYYITRRLRAMGTVLERYSDGEYEERMPAAGTDELATLGGVMNSMADAIKLQIEKLKQVDLVRRELVASIAHDIRNPIAQIRLSLEAARDIPDSITAEQKQFIDGSLKALDSLNALIEDLFELSKLSADGFKLKLEPIHLGELIEDIAVSFTAIAEAAQITLQPDIAEHNAVTCVDAKFLSRALSNLIDNSIKYSDAGGKVQISLTPTAEGFLLRIADEGVGIAPEDLERLAQPFHRGRHGRIKHEGGTGLGLAIARKVVELHGGTLTIRNAEPRGAEVLVTLPRITAVDLAAASSSLLPQASI